MSSTLPRCVSALTPITSYLRETAKQVRHTSSKIKPIAALAEDFFATVGSAANLSRIAYTSSSTNSNIEGSPTPPYPPVLDNIEQFCVTASGLGKLTGTTCHMAAFLSGGSFYEVEKSGNFIYKVHVENGVTTTTRVRKSMFSILSNVTRLASNIVRCGGVLNDLKVVNLGCHAANLSISGGVLGLVSSSFGVANDVSSIYQQTQQNTAGAASSSNPSLFARCKMLFFSLLCNIVDLICEGVYLIFATMPQILGAHVALILGIFGFLSAAGNTILDLFDILG